LIASRKRENPHSFANAGFLLVIPAQAGIQWRKRFPFFQYLRLFRYWIPACAKTLFNSQACQ
jgi:hypothetical protein